MTREEAIHRLEEGAPFSALYDEVWENALVMAIEALKSELIVHCKDCKYHEDEELGMVWCPFFIGSWVENDFHCAIGEKREETMTDEGCPRPVVVPIKHGHDLIGDTLFECSECGYYNDDTTRGTKWTFNYCPNYGAKMDAQIGEDKSHPFAESVMMGMDGGENESSR